MPKAKREQLVNKVMGIELFDDAASNVKEDTSNRQSDLEIAKIRLQSVEQNKEEYESKLSQKTILVSEIETNLEKPQRERNGNCKCKSDPSKIRMAR